MNRTILSPPTLLGSHAPQVALALCVFVLVATLGVRIYGNRFGSRPTEHILGVRNTVDLNQAEKSELVQLPDVGPALADAILSHRRTYGRFATVDDLSAVQGVGPKTLTKLRPWLTIRDSSAEDPSHTNPTIALLERKPATVFVPVPSASLDKLHPGDPPLDVNTAAESDLIRLPGVGPTLARRIVEARGLDRFRSAEDLRRVKGIGPKTLDAIRQYVICR